MQIKSLSEEDTSAAAKSLAERLCAPCAILLQGPLGSGKSVFARSLIRTLMQNEEEEVPSPTFTLVQTYEAAQGLLWHFDLYRLKNAEEVYDLGWEDALNDLCIVEWPERLGALTPRRAIHVEFVGDLRDPAMRVLHISGDGL